MVKEVEEANLNSGGGRRRVNAQCWDNATSLACKYNNMVLGGKVRAAIQMVTNRRAGGLYCPHDLDSMSGCLVINVLWDKHPDCCVPLDKDFGAYPNATNLPPCQCIAMRNALQKQLHVSLVVPGHGVSRPRC